MKSISTIQSSWQAARRSRPLWVLWTFALIFCISVPVEVAIVGNLSAMFQKDPLMAAFAVVPILFFAGLLIEGLKMCWADACNFDKPVDNIMFLSFSSLVAGIVALHFVAVAAIGPKTVENAGNYVCGKTFEIAFNLWFPGKLEKLEQDVARVKKGLDQIDFLEGERPRNTVR